MIALSSYNEQELLRQLSAGDKDAFAEMYNRYWQFLIGMAYNRLKNWQAAEDVVHDVFASIWSNRQKLEIQSLQNYLATAVKYMILKEVRKAALHRTYSKSGLEYPPYIIPSDSSFDNKRILQLLQQEIELLPEKCRLIFRFSREQGMTAKEIAGEMNISPKTVENQLNKALKQLRVTIKKHALIFSCLLYI